MTDILERRSEQLKALGHPVRLAILRMVVQGPAEGTPAGEIQARLSIPASTLSHHLETLASADLLKVHRDRTFLLQTAHFEELRALTSYLWEDCCQSGVAPCCGPEGSCS